MTKPAARFMDGHSCPAHKGGPIVTRGDRLVYIERRPAIRILDYAKCEGATDVVMEGAAMVFIGGLSAARLGDACAHGGTITQGASSVFIGGESASASGAAMSLSAAIADRKRLRQKRKQVQKEYDENARLLRMFIAWHKQKKEEIHKDKSWKEFLQDKEAQRNEPYDDKGQYEKVTEWEIIEGKIEHHTAEDKRLRGELDAIDRGIANDERTIEAAGKQR